MQFCSVCVHSVNFVLQITFLKPETCKKVCASKEYKKGDASSMKKLEFLKKGILQNYQHHW